MSNTVAKNIASLLLAIENCKLSGNTEWQAKHKLRIDAIIATYAPRGSGIDCGTRLDWDRSTPEKLVFNCDFHHMNENGSYDGWTKHTVVCTASLAYGFNLKITGKNRNDIKAYLAEVFYDFLDQKVTR